MKKLHKLQINPEKLIKEDDLKTIQGGYGGACCLCWVLNGNFCLGAMAAASSDDCHELCDSLYPGESYGTWNC